MPISTHSPSKFSRALLALLLLGAFVSASAQQVPPSAQPGQIERRLQPRDVPRSQPGQLIPAPGQAPPPAKAKSVKFVLLSISIRGNTVFTQEELLPLYSDLLNRKVSLFEVYAVRDAITAKYRDAGYVLTQAVIPQQTIEGGVLQIEIVNGAINNVHIHGSDGDRRGLIEAYAARIKAIRPVRSADIERYVLLMNDLPGVKVRTVLSASPGNTPGSDLDLYVEQKSYEITFGVDNRGTEEVGPYEFNTGLNLNNLAGLRDQFSLRFVSATQTRELSYLQVNESLPVNSEGTLIFFGTTQTWSRPGGAVESLSDCEPRPERGAGCQPPADADTRADTARQRWVQTSRRRGERPGSPHFQGPPEYPVVGRQSRYF